MGGWDAALAQMLGLWVRRRLWGGGRKQKILKGTLSRLLLPVIKFLYERVGRRPSQRHRPPKEFREGMMITGLKGTARKI